jgi:hypothetical protein
MEWKQNLRAMAASSEGLEIVGEVEEPLGLLLAAREAKANLVALSQLEQGGEPGICSHLLLEYPNVGILLLPARTEGRRIYWMVTGKRIMRDSSVESVRTALREFNNFVIPNSNSGA